VCGQESASVAQSESKTNGGTERKTLRNDFRFPALVAVFVAFRDGDGRDAEKIGDANF
jgi:hypothetical protein